MLEVILAPRTTPLPNSVSGRRFAVLIDCGDHVWRNEGSLYNQVRELVDLGCRYFICFGSHSELIHDKIDEIVLEIYGDSHIVTTFHEEESPSDVVDFLRMTSIDGIDLGIIFVDNEEPWRSLA